MSADNWAHCPRCTAREEKRLARREAEVQALYGTVPVEEFDKARTDLAAERTKFAARPATFREDYEIHGAESGTVTVGYHGECMDCGLDLSFQDEHPIPEWDL